MKNTLFVMAIATLGFFGISSAVSAQMVPVNSGVLNSNIATITAASSNTTNYASKYKMISNAVVAPTVAVETVASVNPSINATISPITVNPNLVVPVVTSSQDTLINEAVINPNVVTIPTVVTVTNPVVSNPVVSTPVVVTTTNPNIQSGNGTNPVTVGSYGYGSGSGAYVTSTTPATVAVAYTAPKASTTVTKATVAKNPVTIAIDSEVEKLSNNNDFSDARDNQFAASTYGLGSINLITVLLAIAVLLAGLVAFQQYEDRKKKAKYAVYA